MRTNVRSAMSLAASVTACVTACVIACAASTLTACSHNGTSTSTSPVSRADSLIVSLEDVRRIANHDELTYHSHADLRHPPEGDMNAPGPCRAAGASDLTFATGWTEFRSAGYHGITDDLKPGGPAMIQSVSQAVAIYPEANMARGALHQLEGTLQACADLHDPKYDFKLDRPDSSTLKITAEAWCHLYREKSSVLLSVGVVGYEPADRIANSILQTATERLD